MGIDIRKRILEALGLNRRVAVAENAVFHDVEYPSHIVLPVISCA